MELAYNRAVRLKYTVEQRMGELIQTQQKDLEVETGQLLNECQDAFETYEVYVRKRPVSERDKLKQELDQMRADIQDTENKYKAYVAQQEAMRSQAEDDKRRRDQLLTRRGDDTEIYISSHDVAYSEGLTQANSGIENLLRTGAGILDDLSHQRDVMKVNKCSTETMCREFTHAPLFTISLSSFLNPLLLLDAYTLTLGQQHHDAHILRCAC
eukprot:m.18291 g.18291  ORF g.18291 m.18291 type:complete len:212 (+) comp7777_c0_seq1:278-913(+)